MGSILCEGFHLQQGLWVNARFEVRNGRGVETPSAKIIKYNLTHYENTFVRSFYLS